MSIDSKHERSSDSGEQPLVSIIMPVYNSEDYVEEAIRSLLDQDFDSFEIVAVDDGSTDDSSAICDRIAAEDARLRVIHKTNGGLCAARNTGMGEARGKYLMFCDNDDVVYSGFIADNYRLAEEYDADIVRFGRAQVKIDAEGQVISHSAISPEAMRVFEGEAILANIDSLLSASRAVWAGIYRKDFLTKHDIQFDESLRSGGEDIVFNDQAYVYAQKIVINPHVYYEWRRRGSHSTSMGFNENLFKAFAKSFNVEDEMMKNAGVLQRNPSVYADVMCYPLMDTITAGAYARDEGFAREESVYRMLHKLYQPYFSELKSIRLKPSVKVALRLLEARRYRMLYEYVHFGIRLKKLVKKDTMPV